MHDQMHDYKQDETQSAQTPVADRAISFTCREWVTFLQLRRRYQAGHDLWDARELAHLRFLRWRHENGLIDPS